MARVAELERAFRQIQDELGAPDNTYPASVANAWKIAGAALGVRGEGECIGWPDCYCGSGLTSHSPRCEKVRGEATGE